jgi:rare lipoprotein A
VNARIHGRRLTRALVASACMSLAIPAVALASSSDSKGGSGLPGSSGGQSGGTGLSGTTGSAPVTTSTPSAPVSVSSGGVTLQTSSAALLRHGLSFTGTATGAAGKEIEIEREGRATDNRWMQTATATVSSDGTFQATWHTSQVGRFAMRAIVVSNLASAAAATPSVTISVYRGAKATIYGPGFYGKRTACGQRLTRSMIGVANRSLPCGTDVSILYNGHTLSVPVIDRGPYANGANWDLTMATATALGMDGTEWIGTLSLPSSTTAPTSTAPSIGAETLGELR